MRHVLAAILSGLSVLVVATQALALDPSTKVWIRSPYGYQVPSDTPLGLFFPRTISMFVTSGPSFKLGRFNAAGNVIGGDAVLVVFVHKGSAPITFIAVDGAVGGLTQQVGASVVPRMRGRVVPPETAVAAIDFRTLVDPEGEGEAFIAFALLTNRTESLEDAPGVLVPLRVLIGQPEQALLTNTGEFIERPMTPGGAAPFRTFRTP